MKKVRVALIQDAPVVFDLEATMEKVVTLTEKAAEQGGELVLFPEAFISAYPKGLDFGARVGLRLPSGREDFRRYFESAIEVPGPKTRALEAIAKKHRIYVIVGAIERDGGTLYCSALFFSPEGRLMGLHRKLMPTASERLVWGFGDGSTMPVFETTLGRIGAVICWENYMPMLRMHMYSKNIQIYCALTADDRDTWLPTVQTIALEGRCFVLSCCQYLLRRDCPSEYDALQGKDPHTVLIRGGSCVVGPLGRILAGPHFEGPGILTADLDLDDIVRGKYDFDVTGHYARPDVFRLHVNENPSPAVVSGGASIEEPFRS